MVHRLTISRSIAWKTFSGYFFPGCGDFVQKLLHSTMTVVLNAAAVSTPAGDSDNLQSGDLKIAGKLHPVPESRYVF